MPETEEKWREQLSWSFQLKFKVHLSQNKSINPYFTASFYVPVNFKQYHMLLMLNGSHASRYSSHRLGWFS